MKKIITTILCCALTAGLFTVSAEDLARIKADNEIKAASANLEKTMTAFAEGFSKTVAPNAVQHNVWADAYIGKLIPAFPPHFGGGVSFVSSSMNEEGLSDFVDSTNLGATRDLVKNLGYPLPAATGNLRIGGLFLPFDVGVSFMKYKKDDILGTGMAFDYMTVGVDVRYAIMEQSLTKPDISVGFGWTKVQGNLSKGFSIIDEGGKTLGGLVATGFDTNIFCFSGQISKGLLGNVLTPYAGTRLAFQQGSYERTTSLKGDFSANSTTVAIDYNDSFNKDISFGKKPVFQLYGGLGFRALIIDTNLGICYDFISRSFGSNFSFRLVL